MRSPREGEFSGEFTNPDDLLQYVSPDAQDGKTSYICSLCEKFRHKFRANVRNHVESQHFRGAFMYPCDICGMESQSKQELYSHKAAHNKKGEYFTKDTMPASPEVIVLKK